MTSRSTESPEPVASGASAEQLRTNPRLLHRHLAPGMVVCVAGESVYQDVRVLRLDDVARSVVEHARQPVAVAALAGAVEQELGGDIDGFDALVDGLVAARVLERVAP